MTKWIVWLAPIAFLLCAEARGAPSPRPEPPVFHVRSKQAGIDISTRKVAILYGEINEVAAAAFQYMMLDTMRYPGDRLVFIDSVGGDAGAGEDIINLIDAEKAAGTRVVCLVGKWAASMAFDLLTHCDVRIASEQSRFVFHKIAYARLDGSGADRLTPERLRELANQLEQDDAPHAKANRKALHMSAKDYDMYARHDHTWLPIDLIARKYLHGIGGISNK